MDQEHDNYETYLTGTMPSLQRGAFEARLKEDAGFAREFSEFRAMYDVVNLAGEIRLKATLAAIHEQVHAGGTGRVIPFGLRNWLAIAASLLLLIASSYYFLSRSSSPQDLFAEHMSPYSGPDRTRSDVADAQDHWLRFAELYDAGRYDEALAALGAVAPGSVPPYLIAFYRGECLLLKNEPDPRRAIASFEQVLITDNDLHAITQWYIGLALLSANDLENARSQFEALRAGGDYKHQEAARILEELPDP